MKQSNNEEKKKVILFDLDYTLFDTDAFKNSELLEYRLYTKVFETLERLSQHFIFGIFSEGEEAFQKEKIKQTQLDKFFHPDRITICTNKKEMIMQTLQKYQNYALFLVDDKKEILQLEKEYDPSVTTVWVRQGPYAESQKNIEYKPDYEIRNINELNL